jgi:hypothetical protein
MAVKKQKVGDSTVYNITISGPSVTTLEGTLVSIGEMGDAVIACKRKYSKTAKNTFVVPQDQIISITGNPGEEATITVRSYGPIKQYKGTVEIEKQLEITDLEGNPVFLNPQLSQMGFSVTIEGVEDVEGTEPSRRGRKKAEDEDLEDDEDLEEDEDEDLEDEDEDEDEDEEYEDDEDEEDEEEEEDEDLEEDLEYEEEDEDLEEDLEEEEDEEEWDEEEEEEEPAPRRGRR